jgi:hypothetical protein
MEKSCGNAKIGAGGEPGLLGGQDQLALGKDGRFLDELAQQIEQLPPPMAFLERGPGVNRKPPYV